MLITPIPRGIANSKSNPPICKQTGIDMDSYANQTTSMDGLEASFLVFRKNQRIGILRSATISKSGDESTYSAKNHPILRVQCHVLCLLNEDLQTAIHITASSVPRFLAIFYYWSESRASESFFRPRGFFHSSIKGILNSYSIERIPSTIIPPDEQRELRIRLKTEQQASR